MHWESVALTDHSAMILNDSLVLGDSGTGSGHLDIDASSSLSSSTGLIRAFDSNQNATLNNSGTIYLTAGGAQASDRLTGPTRARPAATVRFISAARSRPAPSTISSTRAASPQVPRTTGICAPA